MFLVKMLKDRALDCFFVFRVYNFEKFFLVLKHNLMERSKSLAVNQPISFTFTY